MKRFGRKRRRERQQRFELRRTAIAGAVVGLLCGVVCCDPARGQVEFEQPPIDYHQAAVNDPVARLQARIDAGEATLDFDEHFGYLPAALEALGVSTSSQALVFSKTSFQARRISPRTPRALYFGDDVYVGWVQNGDVMEFSAVDTGLGANFYTLAQEPGERPVIRRQTHDCLQCHASSLTQGVPGHIVRSVLPDAKGQPILKAGTFATNHASPLVERWGGWYVTGRHGAQRHLGNLRAERTQEIADVDLAPGANVTDLSAYLDTSQYLTGHSDLVALMVLEHQVTMHNLIAKANFLTRITLRDARVLAEMLDRPSDEYTESTLQRIRSAGEPLVRHLLFSGEARLTEPVAGTSTFAEEFSARGPRDDRGRSLRDLDLTRRMFRYPCSYLVYSDAFDALPDPAKAYVYRRLWEVLTAEPADDANADEPFAHLSRDDRQAIAEILVATKPGLPDYLARRLKRPGLFQRPGPYPQRVRVQSAHRRLAPPRSRPPPRPLKRPCLAIDRRRQGVRRRRCRYR